MIKTVRKSSKKAWVIFTREPVPGNTKTRLMPYFSAEQCAALQKCFLMDLSREAVKADADVIVAYTGADPLFLKKAFGRRAVYIKQRGSDLGQKMKNAISDAFDMGYKRVVLTGTDIPELKANDIDAAIDLLDSCDVVLGPTADGGYYLIGMDRLYQQAFEVKSYGVSSVLEETVNAVRTEGLKTCLADTFSDIDNRADIDALRKRMREKGILKGSYTKRFLTDNLKISIIIPVFNEASAIERMMDQLKSCKDKTEIIFVDGGSTDDTLSKIGSRFTVLHSEKGRGKQMNTGALAAAGDVLFFLHCDSTLPDDFLSEIRRCMSHRPIGCFGVRFNSKNFFMLTNRIMSNYRAFFRGLAFGDQGIFIDRQLFMDSGMFRDIPLMEDYEFSLRMRDRGYRPAMTRRRILTSSRRYGTGTLNILRTEFRMWDLRRRYRNGEDTGTMKKSYPDIR